MPVPPARLDQAAHPYRDGRPARPRPPRANALRWLACWLDETHAATFDEVMVAVALPALGGPRP